MSAAPADYAARAAHAYAEMEDRFRRSDGLYRGGGLLFGRWRTAHLWPFARAFVATLDLAGVGKGLVGGFDADAAIAERLTALERYWDPDGEPPAYVSDVIGTRFGGGDRYYDDNAWVGLALVQLERLRPGAGNLWRVADLFRFAVSGWDRRSDVPSPGGVFWVEQGRGMGRRNHDRNTVSNAPNVELGLHLAELTGASPFADGAVGAEDMYEWVNAALDGGSDGDAPATGLYWDKLRGDHTIDTTLWSYNQGSMVGANVLLHRRTGEPQSRYLARAETIARKSLRHYHGSYGRQPPAFNAIFFRNLLLLHAATGDCGLQAEILDATRAYTEPLWSQWLGRRGRLPLRGVGASLLDQSALVQLLALLAWDPGDYAKLA